MKVRIGLFDLLVVRVEELPGSSVNAERRVVVRSDQDLVDLRELSSLLTWRQQTSCQSGKSAGGPP